MCHIDPDIDSLPLNAELNKVRRLLRLCFCSFSKTLSPKRRLLNKAVFCLVCIYQIFNTLEIVYALSTLTLEATNMSNLLVRLAFSFQVTVSLYFVFDWQRKCKFRSFAAAIHQVQNSAGCIENRASLGRLLIVFRVFITLTIIFFAVLHLTFLLDVKLDAFSLRKFSSDITKVLFLGWNFFCVVYSSFASSIGIFMYSLFTYGAVLEARLFNNKLTALGKVTMSPTNLMNELVERINEHGRLGKAVRELDGMCEVFAFLMLGSTIPVSAITLLQLLGTRNMPLINFFMSVPLVAMNCMLLISLTAIPAMLHNVLDRSKHHLYGNLRVWQTFDKDVYVVANSLATHLNQPDLGISVWGFAMVSKPLILTTISVMVTCIAFLLELRKRPL
uniref:Gustatory receptor n=1 Tax=Panagrellus redivivus TaxID=6233 RepID=A0A7E4VUL3_PANRE